MARPGNPSPFKFLEPYDVGDRALFFGRERETRLLLADVIARRLVLLFAKSGTGKTSLINAGVRPALEDRDYATFYVRVREDPARSARDAIAADPRVGRLADGSFVTQATAVASELDQPIVLFFDQFEEFFVYLLKDDPARATAFIADVASLYRDRQSGVHLVFSMREEFFVEMDAFHDHIPTVFEKDAHLRLRWFAERQAREAIAGPAREAGAEADPRLVDRLVADLALDGWIEPAQLQIVCHTLWGRDGLIDLEGYRALSPDGDGPNPARRILDRRLGQAFQSLAARRELQALERLLPALRTPRGTKYVRDLDGLVSDLGVPEGVLRAVIAMLDRALLVTTYRRDDHEYVELTHDYLVERLDELAAHAGTIWPRRVLAAAIEQRARAGQDWRPPPELDDVAERVRVESQRARRPGDLALDRREAEVLFVYSLERGLHGPELLQLALDHGLPAWELLGARLESPDPAAAGAALAALAGVEAPEAVQLLERALEQPRLVTSALDALARLAGSSAPPRLADHAAEVLFGHLEPAVEDPERAAWAISVAGRVDHMRAVGLLERLLAQPATGAEAEDGLLALVDAPSEPVRTAARRRLIGRWWLAVDAGRADAALLHRVARVQEPEAVELLERAGLDARLAGEARKALVRLEGSPDAAVAERAAEARSKIKEVERPRPVPPPSPVGVAPEPSGELGAHHQLVARALAHGELVPFLGPGANMSGRPSDVSWERSAFLPNGRELAQFLAASYNYPDRGDTDLLRVAQYATVTLGSGVLYRDLHAVFDADYPPAPVHRFLAAVPARLRERGDRQGLLIVTTNFDDTLERAFAERGEPIDVLTYIAHGRSRGQFAHRSPDGGPTVIGYPQEYDAIDRWTRPVLLKLHGGIDREDPDNDSFVITEDDYIDYLVGSASQSIPVQLRADLARSRLLFLGFSLRDWSSRASLARVVDERRHYRSWAVALDPTRFDTALWPARDIDVLDVALDAYMSGLDAALQEAR